jgi:hypothetical protein
MSNLWLNLKSYNSILIFILLLPCISLDDTVLPCRLCVVYLRDFRNLSVTATFQFFTYFHNCKFTLIYFAVFCNFSVSIKFVLSCHCMFVFKKYDRQNHVWSFMTTYLRFLCKFTSWSGETPTGNFSDTKTKYQWIAL